MFFIQNMGNIYIYIVAEAGGWQVPCKEKIFQLLP
jgi:hypothetical protein